MRVPDVWGAAVEVWHAAAGMAGQPGIWIVGAALTVLVVLTAGVWLRRLEGLERWTLGIGALVMLGAAFLSMRTAAQIDRATVASDLAAAGLDAQDLQPVADDDADRLLTASPDKAAGWLALTGDDRRGRVRVVYEPNAGQVSVTLHPVQYPRLRDEPGGPVTLRLALDADGRQVCHAGDCRALTTGGVEVFGHPADWWRSVADTTHAALDWEGGGHAARQITGRQVGRLVREDPGGAVECVVTTGRPQFTGPRQVVDIRCRAADNHLPVATPGAGPDVALVGPPPDPREIVTDPNAAASVTPEALLAAGRQVAGNWTHLSDGIPRDRPVYVGAAYVSDDQRKVSFEITVAFTAERRRESVKLNLAAVDERLATIQDLTARRAGEETRVAPLRDTGRVVVRLDPPVEKGEVVSFELSASYRIRDGGAPAPDDDGDDDGGSAQASPFGGAQLGRLDDARLLAGWLPTLLLDDRPDPDVRADRYGRNPAAIWSLRLVASQSPVSGAWEADCPAPRNADGDCTWLQAVELPEVAVVLDEQPSVTTRERPVAIRVAGSDPVAGEGAAAVADWAARSLTTLTDRLGHLPWRHLDVAVVQLDRSGVEGIGFPGLVLIDSDQVDDPTVRPTLVAHEISHQWMGGLVAADDFSGRLVLESLAVYLSWVVTDTHLPDRRSADTLSFVGGSMQHLEDLGAGATPALPDPADPIAGAVAFELPYGRGAMGWLTAEARLDRDAVVDRIARFVDERAGTLVDADIVIERTDGALRAALRRHWLTETDVAWLSVLRDLAAG